MYGHVWATGNITKELLWYRSGEYFLMDIFHSTYMHVHQQIYYSGKPFAFIHHLTSVKAFHVNAFSTKDRTHLTLNANTFGVRNELTHLGIKTKRWALETNVKWWMNALTDVKCIDRMFSGAVTVIWYPLANFAIFTQKFAPDYIAQVCVSVPWPLT